MRTLLLASAFLLFAIAQLPSAVSAAGGFFRPIDVQERVLHPGPAPTEKLVLMASASCSIQARYNIATPGGQEITFIGGGACISGLETAINAVRPAAAAKVSVPGEPSNPVSYQCGATVNFDPATPASATAGYTGAGCDVTRFTAWQSTRQAVLCQLYNVPCLVRP